MASSSTTASARPTTWSIGCSLRPSCGWVRTRPLWYASSAPMAWSARRVGSEHEHVHHATISTSRDEQKQTRYLKSARTAASSHAAEPAHADQTHKNAGRDRPGCHAVVAA